MKNWIKQTRPIRPPAGHVAGSPRPPNVRYVYALTAFVCLGAFLFGWDQGVMSMIIADERWLALMQPSSDCTYCTAAALPTNSESLSCMC
jgi:hypothetical protein